MVEYHIHRFSLTRMIDDDADGMLEWKQRTSHMTHAAQDGGQSPSLSR
jgi:hypothetical protein